MNCFRMSQEKPKRAGLRPADSRGGRPYTNKINANKIKIKFQINFKIEFNDL
jgi:hypothetical protein